MNYREIEIQDLPEIFDVRIATWHNPNGREELTRMGITEESVTRMIQQGTHRGWLCEANGKIVGFAMGDQSTGEMWVIAVLKEHEGCRIGRELLTRVEEWLFSESWKKIWLTTDTDETLRAVGFYRHLGWTDWKFQDGDRFMHKFA